MRRLEAFARENPALHQALVGAVMTLLGVMLSVGIAAVLDEEAEPSLSDAA